MPRKQIYDIVISLKVVAMFFVFVAILWVIDYLFNLNIFDKL
jgi:preprotein translocase subunit SecE